MQNGLSNNERFRRFRAQYLEQHPAFADEYLGWCQTRDDLKARLRAANAEIARLREVIYTRWRRAETQPSTWSESLPGETRAAGGAR